MFLQPQGNIPSVVINANVSLSEINFSNSNECIKKAAEYLREDIIKYSESLPELCWPPNINELPADERTMPPSLITFLRHMLKTTDKHNIIRSSNALRLIDSYASDLIYGVTRGKVVTAKHFLLALGLHNITGMKNPIEICNRLRHCIPYHLNMEIQTAQTQKELTLAEASSFLPLKPAKESDVVLTFYWVDNFDVIVEKQAGGGTINTTHLVAFQEPTELSVNNTNETISVEYSRKRTVENIEPKNVSCGSIDSKREPRSLNINENIC